MKNRKTQNCWKCGKTCKPGEGSAVLVNNENSMLGFSPLGETGWFVSCLDKDGCKKRREEKKEEYLIWKEGKREKEELINRLFNSRDCLRYSSRSEEYLDGEKVEILEGGYLQEYRISPDTIYKINWIENFAKAFPKTPEREKFLRENAKN